MEEKEELKNNNQLNMEPAAKISALGKTFIGAEDPSKTHIQEVADCPEGTPEEKELLIKALKIVEEREKQTNAQNYIKETSSNSTFHKSQKVQIKQPKKQEQQVEEQQITNQDENNIEKTR